MKLIQNHSETLVTLGQISWEMGVGVLCMFFIVALILRNYRLAFIIPIIATSIVVVIIRAIFYRDQLTIGEFGTWLSSSHIQAF